MEEKKIETQARSEPDKPKKGADRRAATKAEEIYRLCRGGNYRCSGNVAHLRPVGKGTGTAASRI